MAIYDKDGTADYEIGKLYDNDGTTYHQIGKVYDNDGAVNSLIYTSDTVIVPNIVDYPQSAYSYYTTDEGGTYTYSVTESGATARCDGNSSSGKDRKYGFALNFPTDGHKYLNITYSCKSNSSGCHGRIFIGVDCTARYGYSTLIKMLLETYEPKTDGDKTAKIDISAYSNVGFAVYFSTNSSHYTTVTISNVTLTDE